MSRALSSVLFAASVASAAACVDDPGDRGEIEQPAAGGAIRVLGSGKWFTPAGCPSPDPSTCFRQGHFWVDVEVRNDAFQKRFGVAWIDTVHEDPAAPWHVSLGSFEAPLAIPYERWGVDVATGVYGGIEPNPQIRFAAFVEMNGQTYWDNNDGADYVVP